MAILWEKTAAGKHYKVTSAGASKRLYTNGVFHSQYNPNQPVAGNLWDLLFIPALMHPQPQRLERVLVLGVGGGAVIQQLNGFLKPQHITGVDLDRTHLQVARRFFKVNKANVTLVQSEAAHWLENCVEGKFDLIIEDLFRDDCGPSGPAEPVRAIEARDAWFECLLSRLSHEGVLVMNFESGRRLSQSGYRQFLKRRDGFSEAFKLTCNRYENAIGVFARKPAAKPRLYDNLKLFKELDQRRKTCRLNFHCRKL